MLPENLRRIENFHIFLWLLKDVAWVRDFQTIGMFMVFPTLLIALWIAYRTREDESEFAHNVAVCSWISANSVWMTGEFFFNDGTRDIATVFFCFGVLVVSYHYLKIGLRRITSRT